MIITTDLIIRDKKWRDLTDLLVTKYGIIETLVECFIICAAIGVCDGEKEESVITDDDTFVPLNLPRSVLSRPENNMNLDFIYQCMIFSTESSVSTTDKINLAFRDDESSGNKKLEQLRLYANYGMRIISESLEGIDDEYLLMEELLTVLKDKTLNTEEFLDSLLETGQEN